MKKTYSKPDILFEDFSLSTNIASTCEEKPYSNTDRCGVRWTKDNVLFSEYLFDNCTKFIDPENNEYNNLCYHNPFDAYNVFYS